MPPSDVERSLDVVPKPGRIAAATEMTPARGEAKGRNSGSEPGAEPSSDFEAGVAHAIAHGLMWPTESLSEPLIALTVRAAETLFCQAARSHPLLTEAVVEDTLQRLQPRRTARVQVHPDYRERLAARLGPDVAVEGDPALAPGECLVTTPTATADGRLSVRLELLEAALRQAGRRAPPST